MMEAFVLNEHLAGHRRKFEIRVVNLATGEARTVTEYATDGMAAYALAFAKLDKESGDRSWCAVRYTVEDA